MITAFSCIIGAGLLIAYTLLSIDVLLAFAIAAFGTALMAYVTSAGILWTLVFAATSSVLSCVGFYILNKRLDKRSPPDPNTYEIPDE